MCKSCSGGCSMVLGWVSTPLLFGLFRIFSPKCKHIFVIFSSVACCHGNALKTKKCVYYLVPAQRIRRNSSGIIVNPFTRSYSRCNFSTFYPIRLEQTLLRCGVYVHTSYGMGRNAHVHGSRLLFLLKK